MRPEHEKKMQNFMCPEGHIQDSARSFKNACINTSMASSMILQHTSGSVQADLLNILNALSIQMQHTATLQQLYSTVLLPMKDNELHLRSKRPNNTKHY